MVRKFGQKMAKFRQNKQKSAIPENFFPKKCQNLSNVKICLMSKFVKCQNLSKVKICQMSKFVKCQNLSNVQICQMSKFVKCQNLSNGKICQMSKFVKCQNLSNVKKFCENLSNVKKFCQNLSRKMSKNFVFEFSEKLVGRVIPYLYILIYILYILKKRRHS